METILLQWWQKVFLLHLWYLNECLIGLAFFDSKVSEVEKAEMVKALNKPGLGTYETSPQYKAILTDKSDISKKTLSHLVSQNTRKFLVTMNIAQNFLLTNPNSWDINKNNICVHSKVNKLKVVNDAAERGVALIENFNSALTSQEEQKQYLLQINKNHHQKFPKAKKTTLVDNYCTK